MAHPLIGTMGTAYQLLFQDKIDQIQTPKTGTPEVPAVPAPDGSTPDKNNPATSAIQLDNAQKAAIPPPANILNSQSAASLLFPSGPGIGNNTSAADVLKLGK